MIKGLVIENAASDTDKIKNVLGNLDAGVKFDIIKNDGKMTCMIDTRNVDVVMLPGENAEKEEIIRSAECFINKLKKKNTLPIKQDNVMKFIQKDKIVFIEVIGKDSYIYTNHNRFVLKRKALTALLEEIDDKYFVRCHKAYGVNVRHISAVSKLRRDVWRPEFVHLPDNTCLIGVKFYTNVMARLEEWQENIGE